MTKLGFKIPQAMYDMYAQTFPFFNNEFHVAMLELKPSL